MPVNPSLVDEFDPETVPTVGDLLNELNQNPADPNDDRRMEGEHVVGGDLQRLTAEYERTSLKPYVEMFEKHVAAVLRDARGAKRGERLDTRSGLTIAFKEESMDF